MATAVGILSLPRRGAYRFQGTVVATSYPFGLFSKERTLDLTGTLVVWPRSDRPVSIEQVTGPGRGRRLTFAPAFADSGRGDYRGLRSYRPGDDPRDIHWRSTARRAEPIVREYDRDQGEGWWIVLDLSAPDEASAERAVELAASLAADATARGSRFGFAAGNVRVPPPATGGARLEVVLDLLAETEMDGSELVLPAAASECILVTAGGWPGPGFGGVISARAEPE